MNREICPVCDFPMATEVDWRRVLGLAPRSAEHPHGKLCWGGESHAGPAVNWRERALYAEQRAALLLESANALAEGLEAAEAELAAIWGEEPPADSAAHRSLGVLSKLREQLEGRPK